MSARVRLAYAVIALAAGWVVPATAGAAPADVACVGVDMDVCTVRPDTLTEALAAQPGLVFLGAGTFTGTFATATSVEVAGTAETVIRAADPAQPALSLSGATNLVHNVRVEGRLALGGQAAIDDVDAGELELSGADATARNVTVRTVVRVAAGSLALRSSLVGAADPFVVAQGATVSASYSAFAADADAAGGDRIDPPADVQPGRGSPLVDAGDPAGLEPFEPFEDLAGYARVTDGDRNGSVRRDIGAYERQPSGVLVPSTNVLANSGAENGLAGWSGTFTTAAYGDPFLPSSRVGSALGGGSAFWSGADNAEADLFQRIDISASARSIDRGSGTASFSALLGGYGADTDLLTARATFRDPENRTLGSIDLQAVTTVDRGNATNLLHRVLTKPIPQRTRAIDVLLFGKRRAGSYTDAYADNLGLVLSAPGAPLTGGPVNGPVKPTDPPVAGLKPFTGVSVLTGQSEFSRRGRGRMRLLCASATVGACQGSLELQARLSRSAGMTRIARYSTFTIAPGRDRSVLVRLLVSSRAKLRGRRTLPARLIAVTRDGQALQRRATVPVRMRLAGPTPIGRR